MCRSTGDCFIDPTDQLSIADYPFRTTIALRPDGWEVVESCKRLVHVVDKRARLGAQGALTILSKEWFDMEECGITRVVPQSAQSAVVPGGRQQPLPSTSSRPREPRALDLLSHSQPEAVPAHVVPEVDMHASDDVQNDESQLQPMVPDSQPQEDAVGNAGGVVFPPAGAQEVSLVPDRSGITVNEVQLTPNSPIRTLRAACYLGISTSGGKAKLFDRMLSFYDEQQLSFAQEVKASLGPSLAPREQRLIEPPTPAERQDRELTHQPYQEWCPACIAARARPDAHKTDVQKAVNRSITSLSFDLSYRKRV